MSAAPGEGGPPPREAAAGAAVMASIAAVTPTHAKPLITRTY